MAKFIHSKATKNPVLRSLKLRILIMNGNIKENVTNQIQKLKIG